MWKDANRKDLGMKKTHTVSFKYDHAEVLYHKSDTSRMVPLTVVMQQMRVMTDGTACKWYLCRIAQGNLAEPYAEIELVK
jgi:hypothetical protein